MKYISIDIETTGLEPRLHEMLEVGVVSSLGAELRVVFVKDVYRTTSYCAVLHERLWCEIRDVGRVVEPQRGSDGTIYAQPIHLKGILAAWLNEQGFEGKVLVAGKNFYGFDYPFLAPWIRGISLHHRCLDPAMMYMRSSDREPPGMKECCRRAEVAYKDGHTSLGDARMVIELLKRGMPDAGSSKSGSRYQVSWTGEEDMDQSCIVEAGEVGSLLLSIGPDILVMVNRV